ncbi:MAG: dTDP-4-dehydrorhamnose reductase [Chitinophagaceae bacterium]
MNILVFGGIGQLGQCIKKLADKQNQYNFIYLDEFKGNILDKQLLDNLFQKHNPIFAINCAAYTAVDKAEDDIELCRKINKEGAANLAEFSEKYNATLIHVSTDFVFEGNLPKLLNEEDEVNPIGMYGLTKLEGEIAITEKTKRYFTLRTSWLYSEFANNFVKTMLRLGKEKTELGIIADQVGTPTYAVDLAACILNIIQANAKEYGLYHFSNEGAISWYDFAQTIFELANITIKVKPLKTSEYPTKAKRPAFSVMDKSKIKQQLGIEIPYWKTSLVTCLKELGY